MALFMLPGLLLVFSGNRDLFGAVAAGGTASLYLLPVIVVSLWGGRRDVPVWSHLTVFALASGGGVLHFTESSGYSQWLGDAHEYTEPLGISLAEIVGGLGLYALGILVRVRDRVKAGA